MTKREPFAKVVILSPLDDSGQEARALLVGGVEVCHYPFWPSDGEDPAESDSVKINASHEARVKEAVREAVAERDARIAELERALKDTCELMDKCAGRLNVFVAQHAGSRDEYFVFELNRLSVCAGALDAMSRKALAEIKSVLWKKEAKS